MSVDGERLDNGVLELYSLDVGQADATVIITEQGQIVLNDADEAKVADGLEEVLGDRTVERTDDGNIPLVFATTHFHRDHIEGLGTLGRHDYEVSRAIQPDDARIEIVDADADDSDKRITKEKIEDYVNDLEALGVEEIEQVSCGDEVSIDSDAELNVLAPPNDDDSVEVTRASTGSKVNLPPERPNENGAVYKLEGERSALFMGDVQDKSDHYAESWLIQQHDDVESDVDLDADVLFVAHHGSSNATSEEFLDRVDPEVAVVSSDFAKQHNHPTDEVLKNLHENETEVYWTAGHGTVRTDLDEMLTAEQTKGLDTTDAADLAALKHYCRENDVTAETVETLAPGHLPEETPDWVAEAPIVAQTPEEIVDAAITNAETTEDVYETLKGKESHPANRQLYMAIKNDRNEHVTDAGTIQENRHRRDTAERKQADSQPSWSDRVQSSMPLVPDPDVPEYNGPAPDEIEGPFKEEELPDAVKDSRTAKTIRDDAFSRDSPPDYLLDAEEDANTAVNNAKTAEELFEGLRENPGAHTDVMKAIETPHTHLPENLVSQERDKAQTISQSRSHDNDRGLSL
jgi:competence protein ComEC